MNSNDGEPGSAPEGPFESLRMSLVESGVVIIPHVMSPDEIAQGRQLLDAIYALPWDPDVDAPGYSIDSGAAGEPIQGLPDGSRFATNLISKSAFFIGLMERQPVWDLVRSQLKDPILSSFNSLEPVQGAGHQALHRDEGPMPVEGTVTVNTLWVFDDMESDNGATRYIEGTQFGDELAGEDDPRIVYAQAPAGSVIVMNAHVLHGASLNRDGRRRRVVHVFYTERHRRTQTDWSRYLSQDARDALGPRVPALLGIPGGRS